MQGQLVNRYENEELFLAGERVPAGLYRDVERQRHIHLPSEDVLPASLDGRVACYERVDLWKQQIPAASNAK